MSPEYILGITGGICLAFLIRSLLQESRRERERDEMRKHIRRTCQ